MLFNSIGYALFLPIVFLLYWHLAAKSLKAQNLLLLLAGYFFYGCWDTRFLLLLLFSTGLGYFTGLKIGLAARPSARKAWLLASVCINLGLLGFFKYYNFFVENFVALLRHAGYVGSARTLHIILPVGISFYTFHGLSYVFDIYRGKIKPTTSFINYAVFMGFFPLLIAGPIERAAHLLPQVEKPRRFDRGMTSDGLRQILWGLMKKMVIAEGCAIYVNTAFEPGWHHSGSTLLAGIVLFAFQIYGDFSGYSDIAIGTGKLLGFDLLRNFNFPFFSANMTEFWRRWHISLSGWFRDYLFTPLAIRLRNWGKGSVLFALFVTFTICGLWHGANWTCIIFGVLHGLALMVEFLTQKGRKKIARHIPHPVYKGLGILFTFSYTCLAFVFFRAENTAQALGYISHLFSRSLFSSPLPISYRLLLVIVLCVTLEWTEREYEYPIAGLALRWPRLARWGFYYALIATIFLIGPKPQSFIYFQF